MNCPQKLIRDRYLRILGIAIAALLVVSGCTPLTRGDLFTEMDKINSTDNAPPSADAGNNFGSLTAVVVSLDGSGSSDPNPGDTLNYSWSFSSVPDSSTLTNLTIDGANTATPSFVPDVLGDYVRDLAVSDGPANDVDQLTISVHPLTLAGEWMFSNAAANDTVPYGYNGIVNGAIPTPTETTTPTERSSSTEISPISFWATTPN